MASGIQRLAIVALVLAFFASTASAVVIITFDQTVDSGTIAHTAGGVVTGMGIGFNNVTITGAPMGNGLHICTACTLTFTSGALVTEGGPGFAANWEWAPGGTFSVTGTIGALGVGPVTLLSGSFAGPNTFGFNFGSNLQITGFGVDSKHEDLLDAIGPCR